VPGKSACSQIVMLGSGGGIAFSSQPPCQKSPAVLSKTQAPNRQKQESPRHPQIILPAREKSILPRNTKN